MTSLTIDDDIRILDLEELDVNIFRGRSPDESRIRVFGGQVAGQALVFVEVERDDVAEAQAFLAVQPDQLGNRGGNGLFDVHEHKLIRFDDHAKACFS